LDWRTLYREIEIDPNPALRQSRELQRLKSRRADTYV
jgi:hypothetical protein